VLNEHFLSKPEGKLDMNTTELKSILNSLLHPTQLEVILGNVCRIKYQPSSNKIHLKAAIDWLCRAQDITGCGGCSASYGFDTGWKPPYPETTGYIISTFLKYSSFIGDKSFIDRAKRMGDWEIDIQMSSGAVRGGSGINDYPIIFNTGMVILGWSDLYRYTGNQRYLSAAVKAADWLCLNQDSDGKWSKYTYNGIPHAYHSRVAWSLLEVYKNTNNSKYLDAAIRNIKWVLSLVQQNGWIEEMWFQRGENPLTHTIIYTLRGLLECSGILEGEIKIKTQDVVLQAAEIILQKYEMNKKPNHSMPEYLSGRFNSEWQQSANFSCLTGNAQVAIVWLKIYHFKSDERFLNAAIKITDQLKETHNLNSNNPGIRGGIAGCYPIWGNYMQFCYPNWAAKFFADSLILLETVLSEIKQKKD
jgi:hypothetical protein